MTGDATWDCRSPGLAGVQTASSIRTALGPASGSKKRVDGEARRLCALGATLLSDLDAEVEEGLDHYAVAMSDPEGNEFDIN
jgi:hypothetical protein